MSIKLIDNLRKKYTEDLINKMRMRSVVTNHNIESNIKRDKNTGKVICLK